MVFQLFYLWLEALSPGGQRLTKRIVESIEPGAKTVQVRDTEVPGFGALVTPGGHRSYFLHYSIGRSGDGHKAPRKFVTIGEHGADLTVEEARERARRWRQLARDGIDPAATLRVTAEPQPLTFERVAQQYLTEYSKVHHRPEATRRWSGSCASTSSPPSVHSRSSRSGAPT